LSAMRPALTSTASPTWTTIAASFGFAVGQLDVTIVNVALPRLASELHMSLAGLQWVVDAYVLVFSVLLLLAGVMSDRLGARRTYLLGLAGFALASLACGAAQSQMQLIASRAVQGAAVALMVPPSLAMLNHACGDDLRLRARAVATWTAAGGISIAAGPVVGGLLLESFGWRSIFLVNLPLCLIGMLMTLRVPETPRDPSHHFDLIGQVLAILSLTGLTGAVIEWGALGVTHPLVWGGLLLAFVCGTGFVVSQAHRPQAMLPLAFFKLPNFSPAIVFGIAMNFTYYGIIFILSLYLQHARHYSALQAGWAYLPLTGTFFISNMISGRVIERFGTRIPMVVGAALDALGFLLLVSLDDNSSYQAMLPAFVLIPLGMGLAVPAMTTVMLGSVDKARTGTASAVLNAARQAGGAIGVAVFGALVAGAVGELVTGLHVAALLSSGFLLCAMAVAWLGIGRQVYQPT
ncbi:MFS transporter, partial [Dyella silvatica]|uniref:MFS transporter n=1 Tax=Dyella silvatica TaxID=2992128 RepID=UPI00225A5EB3